MDQVKVKIVNRSGNQEPAYATPSSAGMDVRASLKDPIVLQPMERVLVPTGLYIVDADYRGEIGVILINLSAEPFVINDGERICQMVVTRYSRVEWEAADTLADSERGSGGFGHTGVG